MRNLSRSKDMVEQNVMVTREFYYTCLIDLLVEYRNVQYAQIVSNEMYMYLLTYAVDGEHMFTGRGSPPAQRLRPASVAPEKELSRDAAPVAACG